MLIPAMQRDTSVTSTKEAIEKLGRKAWIYTADMADQQSVKALTPKILADGHELRILVTCAGIQRRHPCEEFPDSDFNEVPALLPPDVKRSVAVLTALRRSCKSTSMPYSRCAET